MHSRPWSDARRVEGWARAAVLVLLVNANVSGPSPRPRGHLGVTPLFAAQVTPNLVADPQFERGVSGFVAQDRSSAVNQSSASPLEGDQSLRVSIRGYGNNVWWTQTVTGTRASELAVKAHLRSDLPSASSLQFCAMAY